MGPGRKSFLSISLMSGAMSGLNCMRLQDVLFKSTPGHFNKHQAVLDQFEHATLGDEQDFVSFFGRFCR